MYTLKTASVQTKKSGHNSWAVTTGIYAYTPIGYLVQQHSYLGHLTLKLTFDIEDV